MKKERKLSILYVLMILALVSLFIVCKLSTKVTKPKKNTTTIKAVAKEENKSEPIDQDLDLNTDKVMNLVNKINVFDSSKAGSYYGYFYSADYLDINNISDDAKVMIGITQNSNFTNDFINSTYDAVAPDGTKLDVIILSKADIQKGINSFFGPNTKYADQDLKDANNDSCGFSKFKFDSTRNVYMSDPINCGAFPADYIDTKVVSAHQTDKQIEIVIKVAYIKFEKRGDDVVKYVYRSLNDTRYIEKHHLLTDNSYNINKTQKYLDSFKFTFTLNSDNYFYFSKVEKI